MLLKITKRRFTQLAVSQTTHSGAPTAIKGMTASCALPAYTTSDMKMAIPTGRPLLTMTTPVTRPQAPMPTAVPAMSTAATRKEGWRSVLPMAARRLMPVSRR
ncbi:hypothetical protein D3C71_1512580 [compost metagenome]